MRTLDARDRRTCATQGAIFEASREYSDDGSGAFVRRFMRSSVAEAMDQFGTEGEVRTLARIVCDVDDEFGGKPYGSERYAANELHWMGYLYRAWCCMSGLSSKAVYRTLGARELRGLYGSYHTLDIEQAVERIYEALQLPQDSLSIEYGVEVMRRVRAERNEL